MLAPSSLPKQPVHSQPRCHTSTHSRRRVLTSCSCLCDLQGPASGSQSTKAGTNEPAGLSRRTGQTGQGTSSPGTSQNRYGWTLCWAGQHLVCIAGTVRTTVTHIVASARHGCDTAQAAGQTAIPADSSVPIKALLPLCRQPTLSKRLCCRPACLLLTGCVGPQRRSGSRQPWRRQQQQQRRPSRLAPSRYVRSSSTLLPLQLQSPASVRQPPRQWRQQQQQWQQCGRPAWHGWDQGHSLEKGAQVPWEVQP